MCIEPVEARPWLLECVADSFKTKAMCNKVVHMDLWLLKYVPDWFAVLQEMWYEDFDDDGDDDDDDDDEIVEWCNAYIKCKAQKAQIKKGSCLVLGTPIV